MRALDPITRADFQRLSALRLREAEDLLAHGHDEGAYYLAGYAVECALKACICRRLTPEPIPPKSDNVRVMYSHRLVDLLSIAGLKGQLDADGTADAALSDYWLVTKDWSEESRYALPTPADAQQLYTAVGDPMHGVLRWLHRSW